MVFYVFNLFLQVFLLSLFLLLTVRLPATNNYLYILIYILLLRLFVLFSTRFVSLKYISMFMTRMAHSFHYSLKLRKLFSYFYVVGTAETKK